MPEALAAGETESHAALGAAVHVRFDPGAPVFVTVACPVTETPVGEFSVSVPGVTAIDAIGSQRIVNPIVPEEFKVA
jgi:hypothetical protein